MSSTQDQHDISQEGAAADEPYVNLSSFRPEEYSSGRGKLIETIWYFCSLLVFESGWLPFTGLKVQLLRLFGARVGSGVVIKPHVRIKYPWRLTIGDHCWIGQNAWIDNIENVTIGNHACISQLAYLCTGSHDHRVQSFDLIARPIKVCNGAWVGAGALVLGGITVQANAIVAAGSVVTKDPVAGTIVGGSPAKQIAIREDIQDSDPTSA